MTETTTIAVELEVESSAMAETLLQVIQHKIEEVKGFELRGRIEE